MENKDKKPNRLLGALSPYLLQHAYNPVDWHEWGEEAFEKAKNENKLMLVSIGYSACHWCHVMAHESFEDEETAQLMNELFVCIKIDREELPDIDQMYMDACQLVNGSGGWPLNAFALPDKRPVHALTYMPRAQWQKLLRTIHGLWKEQPQTLLGYAAKLVDGITNLSLPPELTITESAENISGAAFSSFVAQFDPVYGGPNRAPKFPMPNNYMYLLQFGQSFDEPEATGMASLTLEQMALGGIYDPVAGGFARYSVDNRWFAPHFEKMLYDNAQLIGLYSYAYSVTGNLFFHDIARQTIEFCTNEMKAGNGLFYSAYDADSEGVEGLYYTYTYPELESVLGENTVFFCQYFQCSREGNWEHGRNILYALNPIPKAATAFDMEESVFRALIEECLQKLKAFRDKRIKPGLDDKCICSWNNLMLKALAESSTWLGDKILAEQATELAQSILSICYKEGRLLRINKGNKTQIPAFLEDYASLADGLIALYQATLDEQWLLKAKEICEQTIQLFFDEEKRFFRFTELHAQLAPKYDTSDDVINSGNSIMAHNLWRLSWYFGRPGWKDIASRMLDSILPLLETSAPWYSNWASLQIAREKGTRQVILSGKESSRHAQPLNAYYKTPHTLLGFIAETSQIPLFSGKEFMETERVYVCHDFVCEAPIAYFSK